MFSGSLRSILIALLMAGAGCSAPDRDTASRDSASTPTQNVRGCLVTQPPQITGAAVGTVRIRASAAEVRRICGSVRDTTLEMEGQLQPALIIAGGADTVIAEIVEGRVYRIAVKTSGLVTQDSLRVGTPVRRLAQLAGAEVAAGEGQYFVISPTHCGLSFGLTRLSFAKNWTMSELRNAADSVQVETILVLGACHADGGLRVLGDTTTTR